MRHSLEREFSEIISFVKDFLYEFLSELEEKETIESIEKTIELNMNILEISLIARLKKMKENLMKALTEYKNG